MLKAKRGVQVLNLQLNIMWGYLHLDENILKTISLKIHVKLFQWWFDDKINIIYWLGVKIQLNFWINIEDEIASTMFTVAHHFWEETFIHCFWTTDSSFLGWHPKISFFGFVSLEPTHQTLSHLCPGSSVTGVVIRCCLPPQHKSK